MDASVTFKAILEELINSTNIFNVTVKPLQRFHGEEFKSNAGQRGHEDLGLMPSITLGQAINIIAHEIGHADSFEKGMQGKLSGQLLDPTDPKNLGAQNMDEYVASRIHDEILEELKAKGIDPDKILIPLQVPTTINLMHTITNDAQSQVNSGDFSEITDMIGAM